MNASENPLDRLFQQGLDHAGATPPSAGWAQMEALLDANAPRKRRRAGVWLWAASVLPFLLAGLGYWYLQIPSSQINQSFVSKQRTAPPSPPSMSKMETNGNKIEKLNRDPVKEALTDNAPGRPLNSAVKTQKRGVSRVESIAFIPVSVDMPKVINPPDPGDRDQDFGQNPKAEGGRIVSISPEIDGDESEIAAVIIRRGKPLPVRGPENMESEVAKLEWRKASPTLLQNPPSLFAFLGTRNTLSIPSFHNARETVSGLWTPKK